MGDKIEVWIDASSQVHTSHLVHLLGFYSQGYAENVSMFSPTEKPVLAVFQAKTSETFKKLFQEHDELREARESIMKGKVEAAWSGCDKSVDLKEYLKIEVCV